MSCQVMYQSHYSYFPYQRNIVQPDNKQGIVDEDIANDGGRDNQNSSGGTTNSIATSNSTSTQPAQQQYQNSGYERVNYSRHAPNSAQTFSQQHPGHDTAAAAYSPQHNSSMTESQPPLVRGQSGEQPLPPLIRAGDKAVSIKGERDPGEPGEGEQRSAQYLSANCVIFTYVAGDISKLVDDHFTKALGQNSDRDQVPLSARNLPASFWDCNWVGSPGLGPGSGELGGYSEWADPWHNYMAAQMAVSGGSYSAHQMYHNARNYSSLLLHSRREWVEQNYSSSPYSSMTGLDGGMQSSAKDLYWF